MKINILLILGVLLLIQGVIATEQSIGTYKTGECVLLKQTCGNCTYVNISNVLGPGPTSVVVLNETPMTQVSETNFEYNLCNVNVINGQYIVMGYGNPDGIRTVFGYTYNITPIGIPQLSIFLNPIILILVFCGIALLIVGVVIKNPWVVFLSSIFFILNGIYAMIFGLSNMTDLFTRGFALVFIGIGFVIMFLASYEMWYNPSMDE